MLWNLHCSPAPTSEQMFHPVFSHFINLFTNVSILLDAESIEHHTVAPYTKASFLFLLEWDESSSEQTWLFVWAYLTVSVLFREREERGDEEEEKGGPYPRNHYAA